MPKMNCYRGSDSNCVREVEASTYVLEGGGDDEKLEHDQFRESFLADHVAAETALESDDHE